MVNLCQIAVLFGTGAAVAGVLILPDQAIYDEAAQLRFREPEPVITAAAEPTYPQRSPAAEMAPQTAEGASEEALRALPPETEPNVAGESESVRKARARLADARARLAEIEKAQASIPASIEITKWPFERHSDLTFTPEASFSRIDGTGVANSSSARLLSNLNLGGSIAWRQHWSENFSSRLGLGFSRVDFQGAPNSKTIEQRGKTFGRLEAGVNYCLDDRWELGAGLGMRQEAFYVATGATSLRVDQVAVPRAELSVRFDAVKLEPFRMGLGARSALLFPTSADGYSVKAGSSHRLSLYLKEESANGRITPSGEIFYDRKKQDSSLNRKTETELGLLLGFTWKFGP